MPGIFICLVAFLVIPSRVVGTIISPSEQSELDEICCPVARYNRTKAMAKAIIGERNSRLRRIVFLYRTQTYTQHLHETHCTSPNQGVPVEILANNPRCGGFCEQTHGIQKMITIQPSSTGIGLSEIEVKVGCRFIPTVDEIYK